MSGFPAPMESRSPAASAACCAVDPHRPRVDSRTADRKRVVPIVPPVPNTSNRDKIARAGSARAAGSPGRLPASDPRRRSYSLAPAPGSPPQPGAHTHRSVSCTFVRRLQLLDFAGKLPTATRRQLPERRSWAISPSSVKKFRTCRSLIDRTISFIAAFSRSSC